MPRFIPNQPITFNGLSQPCLNNDTAEYKMLSQGLDYWKLQLDNTPCDGEDGSVCDINMNQTGALLVNSQFTNASEWTTFDTTIFPSFGYAVLYVDSGSNNLGVIYKSIFPDRTYCGTTKGKVYKLSFEIVDSFIQGSCTFYISADYLGQADTSVKLYQGFPFTGLNEMYVYVPANYRYIAVGLAGTDGDFVRMSSIKLEEVAPCWSVAYDVNAGSSSLTATKSEAWTYNESGGRGWFKANPNWNIYNTQTFPKNTLSVALLSEVANGSAMELTYTISNCTNGLIYPVLGTAAGTVRTTNGTFTEYITANADTSCLQFFTDADFDGTVSIVVGKVYSNCHTFDIIDAYTGATIYADIEPYYINNKINFILQNTEEGAYSLESGCYRIRFNDCCSGESYTSDTVINYLKDTEHDCSVLINAYCDGKALGFDFDGLFTLYQRVKMLRFAPRYNNSGNDSDDSRGRKNKTFAKSQKKYTALFNYADEATNDAINAQAQCDTFLIDGEEWYVPAQDIEPDYGPRGKRNLAQIELEMQKKESIIYNRNNI